MLSVFGLWRLRWELRAWKRAGRRPQFWWRDDDACEWTPALQRLIAIAEDVEAPLALAVVPLGVDPGLPAAINRHAHVRVLQHGTDHRNRASDGRPSQFAASTTTGAVAEQIYKAAQQLAPFARALPVYVPPWNDLQANVSEALVRLGLKGVSGHGRFRSFPGLARVDIHLDVMRWGGTPRFRGKGRLLFRLGRLLRIRRRRGCWSEPIGLLTHHLDHDDGAWTFVAWLLAWPPLRNQADWPSIENVFQLREGGAVLGAGTAVPRVGAARRPERKGAATARRQGRRGMAKYPP